MPACKPRETVQSPVRFYLTARYLRRVLYSVRVTVGYDVAYSKAQLQFSGGTEKATVTVDSFRTKIVTQDLQITAMRYGRSLN